MPDDASSINSSSEGYGVQFGRIQHTDWNDLRFLASDILPSGVERAELLSPESLRSYKYWWEQGWWGDQLATPACVAYAWVHLLEDGPVTHNGVPPIVNPGVLYAACKQIDEFPDSDGTTVRAGADVLREQGWLSEYRWCMSAEEIAVAVLSEGPVLMGTSWYEGMMAPSPVTGRVKTEGRVLGGHAYVLNGYSARTKMFRLKNSWGRGWGTEGGAWISKDDVQRLLLEQGEACVPRELKIQTHTTLAHDSDPTHHQRSKSPWITRTSGV